MDVTRLLDTAQWHGVWWGVAGGFAIALTEFLLAARADWYPWDESRRGKRAALTYYFVGVVARLLLGAIVGVVVIVTTPAEAAFAAGVAGPAVLVGLSTQLDRRQPEAREGGSSVHK